MNFWYSQNILAWLLLPLSWLFCLIALLRKKLYQTGMLSSRKPAMPVIIVGNISVGGAGKTPLIIALCELLQQNKLRPGVVSRGYGGKISATHDVSDTDHAADVGDEPLLIHQRTLCPVVIGADRAAAADYLTQHHSCDLILSDDGMQHYGLQRDAEIAVVDFSRLHGNGFCLPAGPLREPVSRLRAVDMVAYHHPAAADIHTLTASEKLQPAFYLSVTGVRNLVTDEIISLDAFTGQCVHAVAGIGHPQRFFTSLRDAGVTVIEHAFADHYAFRATDIEFGDALPVLMTEKDAVKCRDFATDKCWAVTVEARMNSALQQQFLQILNQLGMFA